MGGKHFARRQTSNWDNEPFDKALYDRQIFKISHSKIKALQQNTSSNKQKMSQIAIKRAKKFTYPMPEFHLLSQVKDFLKIYVWREHRTANFNSNSPASHSRSRHRSTSRRRRRSSAISKKSNRSHKKKKSDKFKLHNQASSGSNASNL